MYLGYKCFVFLLFKICLLRALFCQLGLLFYLCAESVLFRDFCIRLLFKQSFKLSFFQMTFFLPPVFALLNNV